ncbi:hypothetical protein os4_38500 (plasmid) [Comamonadaceae bacterium OS-4]|nr:hypothetical protein os4_38500 [Comamonadaceae bacterium OS-4]
MLRPRQKIGLMLTAAGAWGRFVFDDRKGGFDSSTGVGVAIGDR